MVVITALTTVLCATPASAANLGAVLPLGHTMHPYDYLRTNNFELMFTQDGYLVGFTLPKGTICYSWGGAGGSASATFDGVSHHFYIRRHDGSIFLDFGSGGSGTNVSIYNGNFYVGTKLIHGPAPNC